jgi:hypothetical protein
MRHNEEANDMGVRDWLRVATTLLCEKGNWTGEEK